MDMLKDEILSILNNKAEGKLSNFPNLLLWHEQNHYLIDVNMDVNKNTFKIWIKGILDSLYDNDNDGNDVA